MEKPLDPKEPCDILIELVLDAISNDSAHHKQWYLERIAEFFRIPLPDHVPGIAP